MSYQPFNNIVLPPPVQKVVLPPPSQIWDYRLANQIQLNYQTNGQMMQQQQQQHQLPNYITGPSGSTSVISVTRNTSPGPTTPPPVQLINDTPLSYPHNLGQVSYPVPITSTRSSTSIGSPSDYPHHSHSHSNSPPFVQSPTSSSSTTNTSKSKTKPRRKKQCPECHLFFSNLSTHKSIHLNPSSRPYLCQVCGRGFSRSNDLFRHNKRHWRETGLEQGAYKCPFNTVLLAKNHPELSHQHDHHHDDHTDVPCHPTGVFSRCDTYKNHLKALHFEYPVGTKKKMRNNVSGSCKHCGKVFASVNEWLDLHVETGECGFH